MEANAILIKRDGIEKIYIDCLDEDFAKKALNTDKVKLIESRKLMETSLLLHTHLIAFTSEDEYDDNNRLGARLLEYLFVNSDLLVICVNDNLEPIPLKKYKIDELIYLLEHGKEKPSKYGEAIIMCQSEEDYLKNLEEQKKNKKNG